jgi:large subunit ribosomal protein L2
MLMVKRRYIIAPRGGCWCAIDWCQKRSPIKVGNASPLRNIPVVLTIPLYQVQPGKGSKLRSAGTSIYRWRVRCYRCTF